MTTGSRLPPQTLQSLPPAVDQFPPCQPQPLVEVRLSPLAVSPPLHPKLARIVGSRDAVIVIGYFSAEDAKRSAGVVIGGYQQNASSADGLKAPSCLRSLLL